MSERPGVLFRFELLDALEQLDPADAGQLFIGAMKYGKDGTHPTFQSPILSVVWAFVKPAVDHDAEVYDGKVLQKRYAVYVRETKKVGTEPMSFDEWRTSTDITRYQPMSVDIHNQIHTQDQYHNHSHNQDQEHIQDGPAATPPHATRFSPPSLAEIEEYCRERGNAVDPQNFFDFYSAKNWMIGRNKMKDWRASVRTWERRGDGKKPDIRRPNDYYQESEGSL